MSAKGYWENDNDLYIARGASQEANRACRSVTEQAAYRAGAEAALLWASLPQSHDRKRVDMWIARGLRAVRADELEAELATTCNAEELRQVREDNRRLQAEVARLREQDRWHPVHCCRCGKDVPHTPLSELYCFDCYHAQDGAMWVPQLRARIAELEAGLETAWDAMCERRSYSDAWEWKYGKTWDEEDSTMSALLGGGSK